MAKTAYQRLTRARARGGIAVAVMSRTSLWLGADHLLFVDSSGYTENYKRFYFRDIQAISSQRTTRYQWWNGIVGFLTLAFLAFTIALAPKTPPAQWTGGEIGGGIFLGSIAGLCLLLFLINLFLGPTCKTFLRTAVQTEELPPLCRVRQTHKVLKKIRPLIAAAQGGELSPETISEMMRTQAQTSAAVPAPAAADSPGIPPVIDS